MDRTRIALVATGVALVALFAWNAWSLARLDARMGEVETRVDEMVATEATAPTARDRRPITRWDDAVRADRPRRTKAADEPVVALSAGRDAEDAPIDLSDPGVRKELEQLVAETSERQSRERREERSQRFQQAMRDEAVAFADEKGLDGKTTEALLEELERMQDTFAPVREDIDRGDMTWADGRAELHAMRDETATRLSGLLGQDLYQEFEDRVMPGHGRGRGPF